MQEFILAMLETEHFLSGVVLLVVVGFGFFFAKSFWPWFTNGIETALGNYFQMKRDELRIEAERNERFAEAWRENTATLNKQHQTLVKQSETIATLLETHKALIGVFLNFVDDRKIQGRLAEVLHQSYEKDG